MSLALSTIPFHGDSVFLTEYLDEPYTPVKPIVENIGLDWKTQRRKLLARPERWGGVMMTSPTSGGMQEMLIIPLRKLAAFLYSIDPRKVKPELKGKIEQYQAECDQVLWDYWQHGVAFNQRKAVDSADVDALTAENTQLKAKLAQQSEMLELYRFKAGALESQVNAPKIKRPRRIPISDAEKQTMRDLYAQGLSIQAISRKTGRSSASISYIVRGAA